MNDLEFNRIDSSDDLSEEELSEVIGGEDVSLYCTCDCFIGNDNKYNK
ncbi:TIGR04149 family rSAM-modified RiPP [Parabacteroides sp.]